MSSRRGEGLVALLGGALVLVLVAMVVVPRTLGSDSDRAPAEPVPTVPPGDQASELGASPSPSPEAASAGPGGLLVMWARGGLPGGTAVQAETLAGVDAVAFVRSGTVGLTGATAADGEAVERLDQGRRIPLSVVAVDPGEWTRVVRAAVDVGDLRPGTVVLSRTGADLRGIGTGGSIDLATLPGLEVAAVVPDEQTRGAEVVLHGADADAAGLRQEGSLVIGHRLPVGPSRDGLVAALGDLAPDGAPSQVVPGDLAGYRAPLVLSLADVKRTFGEFWFRPREGQREVDIDPAFAETHIITAEVPILGEVRCHRAVIEDLRAALGEIADAGLEDSIDPSAYAGCFYPRRIAVDRDALSRHSWGIALDVNVDLSRPGLGERPPPGVIEAFGRHGFRWGGDFLQPDNHHFEWVGHSAAERPLSG